MAGSIAMRFLVPATALLFAGCGTMGNMQDSRPTVYGGVKFDIEMIGAAVKLDITMIDAAVREMAAPAPTKAEDDPRVLSGPVGVPNEFGGLAIIFGPLSLVDLPFSLVGDTVTLPVVIYRKCRPE